MRQYAGLTPKDPKTKAVAIWLTAGAEKRY